MTTEEKLFVQIFERKNWIIEQVKQQTDFYIQNLASKLLIDGITPPPWLWNPTSHSLFPDPKELNKEELISKLLLQYPRNKGPYVNGHCSVDDQPVVTRDNTELSGRYYLDSHASSKKINESMSMLESRDNDVGSALNYVPKVDFSVTSPRDGTDGRISNKYSAADQSLAQIRRSRSRQRALELRSSAKVSAKSCLNHENMTGICFSGNTSSRIDFEEANQDESSSKSAKDYDVSGKNTGCKETNEGICGEGFCRSNYTDGITKSRSPYKQAVSVAESHEDGYSKVVKEDGGVLLQSVDSAHNDSELKEMANTSDASSGRSVLREATEGKCWDKQLGSDNICGRITRSRSSSLQTHFINRSSQAGTSTHAENAGSATFAQSRHKSVEQVVHPDKLLKAAVLSCDLIGRKTRSQSTSSTEDTSLPAKSLGIAAHPITCSISVATKESPPSKSFNENEGSALRNVLGCQPIPLCSITVVSQQLNAEMETHLVDVHAKAHPLQSGHNLDSAPLRKESEGLVLCPSFKCHMAVQPKQLDFDEMEEYNLNEEFSSLSKQKSVNRLSGERSSAPLDTLASQNEITPDNPNEDFVDKQSQMLSVPTKLEDMEEYNLNEEFSSLSKKKRVNRLSGERSSAQLDTLPSQKEITPDNPNEDFVDKQSQMLIVPTKLEETQNDVNMEKCFEDKIGEFGSDIDKIPVVDTGECNLEAALHNQASFLEDPAPSDVNDNDKEEPPEKCGIMEGYWPSSKLQTGEGELGSKEKISSATTPSKSISKLAEPSVISILSKQKNNELQNFLDKEVGIPEPDGFDAAKHLHVREHMHNIFHAENIGICPERMLIESNMDVREGDVPAHCLIGQKCAVDICASFSGQTEVQFPKSSLSPKMNKNPTKAQSWPQSKRRKVEDQQFNGFSASPSFRMQIPHNIRRSSTFKYSQKVGSISDSGQELQVSCLSAEGMRSQSNANRSSDLGSFHEMQQIMTGDIDSSSSLQVNESEIGSEVGNKTLGTPCTFNNHQSRPSYSQSLAKKAADGSIDRLGEGVKTADNASTLGDSWSLCPGYKFNAVNVDSLTAERNFHKRISHVTVDGLLPNISGGSAFNNQDSVSPDETMPMFEGFIIDGQTEGGGLDNGGDMLNFDTLDLPSTTSEYATILEEILRPASLRTPLSHFSSNSKVHGTHDLYQSVPNGLLECVDLKSTSSLDIDAHKLRASYGCVEELKTSPYGVPYSNSLTYSCSPFGWNSRNHHASPVGKLWKRFSSGSSSSEKRLSSNPELTCFPIKEDPSISEEQENAEEAHEIQGDIMSRVLNDSAERKPLVEITEACIDPAQSISVTEPHPRDSLESVSTEFSYHGTHNRVKQKLRNPWTNKRSTKDGEVSQTSLGSQNTKRGVKSLLHSRFSKPKLSGKTSLKKGAESLSQREPKHNNIVTSLSSFIPLVQQKQAAAAHPAKRDIKVKALEAAELAKRLEEERANERNMKKEALKLERARIQKENLIEMELNKKKKLDEQKKRDADKAARKRLRDEGERKEKEKKRKLVAEGRREQKLAYEKLGTGKGEKNKLGKMDEKLNHRMESENPLEKKKNIVNEGVDENYFKKPNNDPQYSYVLEDLDAASYCDNDRKQMSTLEKTAERHDPATVRCQEISYDISPYQCSDDEDENELPTTKFIPSWASVNFDLPLRNKLDPDVLFPLESFCNMDEVLLPRRLQVR